MLGTKRSRADEDRDTLSSIDDVKQHRISRSIQCADDEDKHSLTCVIRSTIHESKGESAYQVSNETGGSLLHDEEKYRLKTRWTLQDDLDEWEYENIAILAPMVRIGTLPPRIVSRRFGAKITYTEETIDKRLSKCIRRVDPNTGLIEYVASSSLESGIPNPPRSFHTYPGERIALQLGTADGVNALRAASVVARDVRAIDINMGCPKLFSLQAGMGSALLTKPEIVADIVSTLRRNLEIPITCKIRLLSDPRLTVQIAQTAEMCGISAIGIHSRFREDRPRHRAVPWLQTPIIVDALNIPAIHNGDVFISEDIDRYRLLSNCSSVMIARGAMWNYSIFEESNKEVEIWNPVIDKNWRNKRGLIPLEQLKSQLNGYTDAQFDCMPHTASNASIGTKIVNPELAKAWKSKQLYVTNSRIQSLQILSSYEAIKAEKQAQNSDSVERGLCTSSCDVETSINSDSAQCLLSNRAVQVDLDWEWFDEQTFSVRQSSNMRSIYEVAKQILRVCSEVDNGFSNTKYILHEMMKNPPGTTTHPAFNTVVIGKQLAELEAAVDNLALLPSISGPYCLPFQTKLYSSRPPEGVKPEGKGTKNYRSEIAILGRERKLEAVLLEGLDANKNFHLSKRPK